MTGMDVGFLWYAYLVFRTIALSVCRHARIIHATGHARIVSPSHSTCASTLYGTNASIYGPLCNRYGPSLYNLLYTYSLYSYILVPGSDTSTSIILHCTCTAVLQYHQENYLQQTR